MVSQKRILLYRGLFFIASLLFWTSATAQWEKVKENGYREFLSLAKAGNKTIAVSIDGKVFYSQDKGLSWNELVFPANLVDAAKTEKGTGKAGYLYFPFSVYDGGGITSFLLRSNDDGLTWQKLPLGSNYIYNVFAYPNGVIVVQSNGVFRLKDNSSDFQQIAVVGNDKSKFYFTNNRLWRCQGGASYSLDEGDTWNPVGPGGIPADAAVKGDTVCIVNDSYGIYRSVDAGLNWQEVYSQPTNQTFKIHADENGFYRYYYNDVSVDRSSDGFASWSPILNTEFQVRQVIWQDGVYVVATSRGLLRSENNGADWSWIYEGIEPLAYQGDYFLLGIEDVLTAGRTALSTDGGNSWVCAPILPPVRKLLMKDGNFYATTSFSGLYKTNGTDLSEWSKVGPTPSASQEVQIVHNQFICSAGGWLYRSPDEGTTWEQVSYLDASEHRVFLNDSLYKIKNSFSFSKSEDFGNTWDLRGSLPVNPGNDYSNIHIRSANGTFYLLWRQGLMVSKDRGYTWVNYQHKFFDPNGNIQFQGFVTNEIGVFVHWNNRIWLSPDDGQHWISINENLPHQRYGSLVWTGDALFVADYDGNVWKRTDFDFVFNTLFGTVYLDENSNGQLDPQESRLSDIALGTSTGQSAATSDVFGEYALFYGIVPDTLQPAPPSAYTTVQPPYHVIASGDTLQNFAVQMTPDKQDLSLTMTNATPFVPGFDNSLFIRVNNPGTNVSDCELTLVLDDDLQYLNAAPTPSQITGNTLKWEIWVLSPLAFRDIKISVGTPTSTLVGTEIEMEATVQEINGAADLTPENNASKINTAVVSSFDPNDKQVSPLIYTMDSLANRTPLDYTIRFQNTGNFPAAFVYLLDTISPNLDFSTFKLLASSHPVTVSARYGKVVEFFFDNINLSDSLTDEPESHGFVRYSVVPKQQLSPGIAVQNTAHIYFDYNLPVTTNTVSTIIGMLSANEQVSNLSLRLYPNPSFGWLQVAKDDGESGLLTVFDKTARSVIQKTTKGNITDLDFSHLPDGLYFVKWHTQSDIYTGKVFVFKH